MVESRSPSVRAAHMGMLFALALALSFLESMVPIPLPLPGIRLGLSNIVVMYCLFLRGAGYAYCLGAMKSIFVLFTRQAIGAALSLSGGLFSITAMLLVRRFSKDGYGASSIVGAVAHNVGQLFCAAILLRQGAVLWYYLPLLAAVGVLVGLLTAALLRVILPALEKVNSADQYGS